jgi:alpha-1,6-rhamnosyltransferase
VSTPLVSVIVGCYNGERFLEEALESVFAQEFDSYEVVLVDDGSTDGSANIARSYPLVYKWQANQGVAAARNAGLVLARGEFVTFLDADDVFVPTKLRVQASYLLDHAGVGCVLGRQDWIFEDGHEAAELSYDPIYRELGGIQLITAMVRRDVIEQLDGFDSTFRNAEDRDLIFRMREHGVEIAVLPDVVLRKRVHGANKSRTHPAHHPMLRSLRGKVHRQRLESEL